MRTANPEKIYLKERDTKVFLDLIRFKGLPQNAIKEIHFNNSSYCGARISDYIKKNYIDKKYVYAKQKKAVKRIGAIYYLTSKGLKAINSNLSPQRVMPNPDKLDESILIGELYSIFPNLLSSKETKQKYRLDNHIPVKCSLPLSKPILFYIVGNNKTQGEHKYITDFIKKQYFPATHIITSKSFAKSYMSIDAHFIPWDNILEVMPTLVNDPNHYMETTKNILTSLVPQANIYEREFFKVLKTPHREIYFTEFATGNMNVIRNISPPPSSETLVYLYKERDKFFLPIKPGEEIYIYAENKQKFYEVFRDIYGRLNSEEFTMA